MSKLICSTLFALMVCATGTVAHAQSYYGNGYGNGYAVPVSGYNNGYRSPCATGNCPTPTNSYGYRAAYPGSVTGNCPGGICPTTTYRPSVAVGGCANGQCGPSNCPGGVCPPNVNAYRAPYSGNIFSGLTRPLTRPLTTQNYAPRYSTPAYRSSMSTRSPFYP